MPPWGPDLKNTNYSILFYSYIVMCKFLLNIINLDKDVKKV